MPAIELPSLEVLQECFTLDQGCPSGLRWKERPIHHYSGGLQSLKSNSKFSGRPAGCLKSKQGRHKYWVVRIFNRLYRAHRIVWSLHHREIIDSALTIDHVDGDTTNNHVDNLRKATHAQNSFNAAKRSDNTIGFKGVFPRGKRWRAKATLRGKPVFFGTYDTPEEAHVAYVEGAKRLYGEFHNPG